MKEISLNDLKLLNATSTNPMLSLYLSKDMAILDQKSLVERYKELIFKAELLLLKDYTRSFVNSFTEKLWDLDLGGLMGNSDKGVVLFYSPEATSSELLYLRVQQPIKDLVVVAHSFHIKPLIKIKNNVRGFFIVTMSSRAINVLIENQGHLVRIDSYRNEELQNQPKKDSKEFFLGASQELNKLFSAYRLPIVLAGVKDHIGHMRKLLKAGVEVLEDAVIGNVEKMRAAELQERVYELLMPYYDQLENNALKEIDSAIKSKQVLTGLEEIAVSVLHGKVKKLFVLENKNVWGTIDRKSGEISITPKQINTQDDDLLDDLCQIVLEKGGEVLVVKEIKQFQGQCALAIVSDKSHLLTTHKDSDNVAVNFI